MVLPSLHVDRLRIFLAVVEEGGFSRAARKLGMSQSSVSQSVGMLEEELGELLLDREGRQAQLTESGQVAKEHAARIFAEVSQLQQALLARRELSAGRISLGSSDTLATYVLPPVFARFRSAHPAIELSLDNRPSPAIALRVAERALDLGLVSLPLPAELRAGGKRMVECLRITPLAPQRDVVIAPPGHPLADKASVNLRELLGHPLVLLDRSTATRALLDARFRELGCEPHVTMEMSSVEVLKRLVELGFGVSVVPALAAQREVTQGTLRAVDLHGLGDERRLGLITPLSGTRSHAARAFCDVLLATLSG